MNTYSSFIAKSRYCRYLPTENRREHWEETVARYFDFMSNHLEVNHSYTLDPKLRSELESAVVNLEIMPSMRALMTAGPALERDNTAGYNCSYLPIDDPRAFDEAMFILLCGTGVGFSVERQFIDRLPEIPSDICKTELSIVVEDSKEGWADALRQLVDQLYRGVLPAWDVSGVRAAGERLKTFGGRASGPGPLVDLFKFVIGKFKGAQGRKLNSLECHDIMCKIGDVVVVGGVRRSALISLSNLSDDRMRHAKAGQWWEQNGQRALANNSACYTEKPTVGAFMQEWLAIYESHSGERGIINRQAAQKQAAKFGKRPIDVDYGTNPCAEIILKPYQFCNLSEVVVRSSDTMVELSRKMGLCTILGTFQSTLVHFPYLRPIWTKNTTEERLLGVSLTGILDNKILSCGGYGLNDNLEELRKLSTQTNLDYSVALGIPASVAITAVKPSGTVSQLVDAASGIHPRHAPYYIRRVRGDTKDPLTNFMISQGVAWEPCVVKPDTTVVFSFPMMAPEGSLTRDDLTAIEHLELWLTYQRSYCHHKPSVTISVKEEEWPEVGAWCWKHFDELSGVSFLPHDGGSYRQAPYETITAEQYDELMESNVETIDWSLMSEETIDNTEGAQLLACVSGVCEL